MNLGTSSLHFGNIIRRFPNQRPTPPSGSILHGPKTQFPRVEYTPLTEPQVKETLSFIAKLQKSAKKVTPKASEGKPFIEINKKAFDVKMNAGNFTATSQDGTVTMKLFHNRSIYGNPRTFTYSEEATPENRWLATSNHDIIAKAEALGKKLLDLTKAK